ncbi:Cellulose synthase 2 [Colletotrichum truncatum]|uniref:Cellulose synthase 2 n=1 Tax=Colletotrichum truncatum TaxID=5467 RepID=A0ACC3Z230_COLTU|nr:Cellulose synthase 2 [Colletotrichum truncatum]KAF6781699.1 Cellulose synthase 2 [Colletotrichum truncatum]
MSKPLKEMSNFDNLLSEKDGSLKRPSPSKASESYHESRLNSPTTYSFRNDIVDEDSVFIDRTPAVKDQDVMYIAPWRQHVARLFFMTNLIPQLLSFWGTHIQFRTLYHFGNESNLSSSRLVLAWVFVVWEVSLAVDGILQVIIKSGALTGRWQPHLRLLGDNVPSVDVIVTVCNEQIDIVKDTVRAALSVEYPISRFRVIVADDGRSKLLEEWVCQLSDDHPNLYYTARSRLGGWKAGNLNEAVKFAGFLPGGAAELVAGLDADMIPEPRWLRCVTAHIMRDRRVGVVCPAQHFYNVPSDDPLFQSNKFSWYCRDLVCGLAGSGFNLGSGWVMRREAIDDIGGFPTDVLTEDITSSMMAMAEGWKTTYVPEALQWGLVPDTYAAHIKQIVRWYIGGCQMAIKFGFFLLPSRTKSQTPRQVLIGFSQGLSVHLRTQMATLSLILAAVVSMTNADLVYWRDLAEMRMLLRIHCGIVVFRWLHDVHQAVLSGYRAAIWESAQYFYQAPYATVAWFRSFILPRSLGGKTTTFTPTGSIGNVYHERDPDRRAPLLKRLQHIIIGCGAWVHLLIVVLFGTGAYMRCSRVFREHSLVVHDEHGFEILCVRLLRKVAWPTHPWVPTALACFTPIKYALYPPQIPERHKLLGKRGRNGARYPIPEVMGKVKRTPFAIGFIELYTLFVAYAALVFVATWWVDISVLE